MSAITPDELNEILADAKAMWSSLADVAMQVPGAAATVGPRREFPQVFDMVFEQAASAAIASETAISDSARWQYGVEHGWPSHHRQIHPVEKMLGWRMPSQNPPDGKSFDPADYPYYDTAEQAIDAAMTTDGERPE